MKNIFHFLTLNSAKLTIAFIALICAYIFVSEKWKGDNWKANIQSDGAGYYAYLPAIFIHHDLQFNFQNSIQKKYYNNDGGAFYCNEINGKKVNKYFGGVAFLLLPFFLIAYFLSWMLGYDLDGYSYLFQCSVYVGALFYLVIGLIFLRKFLLYYFSEGIIAFTLLLIFFGTNLFYYSVYEASISHVHSFFAVSSFLFFTHKAFRELKRKYFLLSSFFLALIIFLRPANGIIIFALPFLAGSLGSLGYALYVFFKDKKTLIFSLLIGASILFLQLLLYKMQTGNFFVYAYGEEGFNFLHPEIMNVLFSYRKGLFIYTPLTLLALLGFIPLFKKNRFQFFSLLFLLLLIIWIISSWWMWFYGGCFGQRSFIEFFPLFAFLIAMLFTAMKKWWAQIILFVPFAMLVYVNQIQTYQRYTNILPWDNITKDIYWKIFLKTKDKYKDCFSPLNFWPPDEWSLQRKIVFMNDMEGNEKWNDMESIEKGNAHSGEYSSVIGDKFQKSVSLYHNISSFGKDSTVQIRVNAWVNMEQWASDAFLVISFESEGKSLSWNVFRSSQLVHENNKWTKISVRVTKPENLPADAKAVVYFVNNDKNNLIYIDDFEVQFLIYIKGALDN